MKQSDDQLLHLIDQHREHAQRVLRHYCLRAELASVSNANAYAADVWQDVVEACLRNPEGLLNAKVPIAWLLAIGSNVVKKRVRQQAQQQQKEPLARDLVRGYRQTLTDSEILDALSQHVVPDTADVIESRNVVNWMLGHVSAGDQKVIRLSILDGMNGAEVAHELNISPTAARVRLHRALQRLRTALQKSKDDHHERP